jgi:hypothetical protein
MEKNNLQPSEKIAKLVAKWRVKLDGNWHNATDFIYDNGNHYLTDSGQRIPQNKLEGIEFTDLNKALELEDLEKARLAPTKHGEVSPDGLYQARKHSDGALRWYYHPEHAQKTDEFIAQNKQNYLNKLPAEHREIAGKFIDSVANSHTRHAVAALDKIGGKDVPRARHIKGLLSNNPNYTLSVKSPEELTLTAHERHGTTPRSSIFHFSAKGLQKTADKYIKSAGGLHETLRRNNSGADENWQARRDSDSRRGQPASNGVLRKDDSGRIRVRDVYVSPERSNGPAGSGQMDGVSQNSSMNFRQILNKAKSIIDKMTYLVFFDKRIGKYVVMKYKPSIADKFEERYGIPWAELAKELKSEGLFAEEFASAQKAYRLLRSAKSHQGHTLDLTPKPKIEKSHSPFLQTLNKARRSLEKGTARRLFGKFDQIKELTPEQEVIVAPNHNSQIHKVYRSDSPVEWDFKEIYPKTPLQKDAPQAKYPKLLPANQRPEQDVRRIESGGPARPKGLDSYTPSEKVATKQLSKPYGAVANAVIQDIAANPITTGIHDPYDTKLSIVSKKAGNDVIAHEAHHRTTSKLVDKYGVDKVHKIYDNMIGFIHPEMYNILNNILSTNHNYRNMKTHPGQREKLAYKEEIVNALRDFSTSKEKEGRRSLIKNYYKRMNNHVPEAGEFNTFEKFDNEVKKAWKNISNYANNLKPEDLG